MKSAKDQSSSMDFEIGSSQVSKSSTRFAHNQHTGHSNDGRTVNMGRGPTKGNTGSKKAPATAAMPAQVKIKDPDYINGGAQVRTPGGTRPFDPKAGQNYSGNADRINAGRGPTKGNE